MDRRFEWPPAPAQNGQYAPQNGHYPPPATASPNVASPLQANHGPVARNSHPHPQQQTQRMHSQSQVAHNHPIVLIPRPSGSPIYDEIRVQPRTPAQPRAEIHPRAPSTGFHPQTPKIRTVQMPASKSSHSAHAPNTLSHPQYQTPRMDPYQKPVGNSPSLQENRARAHHQTPTHQPSHSRAPLQQHSVPKSRPHPQVVIQRPGPPPAPGSSSSAQPASSRPQPPDYTVLLLAMSEEYMGAAYAMGPVAAIAQQPADLERYYKLISTALGCMEAVLKHYKIHPRSEATLRLKYASVLVEETDNSVEIEDILTKGVALCQRNHFPDIKYSMQHLQARFLFKTNQRAALKSLDKPIAEAETLQHTPWVYALRFLKVSLALQTSGHPEAATALQHLNAISAHAHRHGDNAVYVASCAFQAMVHLRIPGPDSIEQAQRAIASARSLQLQISAVELGHVAILINILDLACSIQSNSVSEAMEKRKIIQADVDSDGGQEEDSTSSFSVLIEQDYDRKLTDLTGGIFNRNANGRTVITFNWLCKRDLYTLAFYLSGVVGLMKGEVRSTVYLKEGIKAVRGFTDQRKPVPDSVPTSFSSHCYRLTLEWQMHFLLGLLACHHGNWAASEAIITSLSEQASKPPFTNTETYHRMVMYLTGALAQSKGQLNKALSIYQSPLLILPQTGVHINDFHTDIALLATMNRILIIRDPTHPQHHQLSALVSQIEPLCSKHPNQNILTAFSMIRVVSSPRDSKLAIKAALNATMPLAKRADNFQFIAMGLNLMGQLFFADSFGEQAQKSVKAARNSSRNSGMPIWQAVASGLLLASLQKHQEAEQIPLVERELVALWEKLPPQLKGVKAEDEEMGM